jgi:hypothetical protein
VAKKETRTRTRTGAYLSEQRHARHLNTHQLAAALGYTNLVKGARRILALDAYASAV